MAKILVTGGAGFIGSAFIRYIITHTQHSIINVDKLTYASNLLALSAIEHSERYIFIQADIINKPALEAIFSQYQPDFVINFAAESHVDRSIHNAALFIQTNIVGAYHLLETAYQYWQTLSTEKQQQFRFHQVSTDEVYGDLVAEQAPYDELARYNPSNPYSAAKASADHLVRAWARTYGFPMLITTCTNNYGPFQHQEKFIPLMILNGLQGKPLPIYGDGQQVRDWLFVDDHVKALYLVLTKGQVGETYNISANNPQTNLSVAYEICRLLEEFAPNKSNNIQSYRQLITHVEDRLGHDIRYGLASDKLYQQLHWQAEENFLSGLRKTVKWYIANLNHIIDN